MATKLGTLSHAKGYVINKLWKQEEFGGHHVPVQFLSEGYPPKWRHLITKAVEELENQGIINIQKKRTGRGSGSHARLAGDAMARARGLFNAFAKQKVCKPLEKT